MNSRKGEDMAMGESAETTEAGEESPRSSRRRGVTGVLGVVLLLAGGLFLGLGYDQHKVGTEVMAPSFDGDHTALVDASSDGGSGIRRGDVVVIRGGWPGAPADHLYTLRVIGLAGDKVSHAPGSGVSVNGEALSEPYAHGDDNTFGAYDITVPVGRVFLLGDSRSIAVDSRAYLAADSGTLPVSHIQGRVAGTAWPLWNLADDPGVEARFPTRVIVSAATALGAALLLVAAWPRIRKVAAAARERLPRRGTKDSW
ncbi:signal peptidase I [Streptomyces sp. NPDC048623]|uniref:signal peptidase I n=1 Tax=Streptomyces sp. NPDC048623 TaxID=3155761 RepID=UPI003445BD15